MLTSTEKKLIKGILKHLKVIWGLEDKYGDSLFSESLIFTKLRVDDLIRTILDSFNVPQESDDYCRDWITIVITEYGSGSISLKETLITIEDGLSEAELMNVK